MQKTQEGTSITVRVLFLLLFTPFSVTSFLQILCYDYIILLFVKELCIICENIWSTKRLVCRHTSMTHAN